MAVTHVYSSPVANATGTQTIWFGATTATVAASDVIQPSNWNDAHHNLITLSGNTAGVSTVSGTNIVFGGSNNVTISGVQGANAATINISAAAGGGGGSINLSAGTTSNNLTNFVFSNSNGVSFGLDGSTVTATVRTDYLTTARASNDAVGLNTAQSNVTWTVNSGGLSLDGRGYAGTNTTFNGANISGSITQNSNGLNLSLSVAPGGGGADGVNILAAGTQTANTTGTVAFLNSNGITFGMSNNSQITASHNGLTTARASNDGVGLNTAQSNVTWTVNSNGISLDARGYAGSGFTSTTTAGTAVVATQNSNGLSMGVPVMLTTARASNDAIGLNTAQSNVTWTVNSGGLSLDARGYAGTNTGATNASVTVNSGGVSVSVTQSNQAVSANNGSYAFQTLSFSNANGISFGTSAGSAITASHNALTTARASNDGIGLATAQTNVTWTVNSAGLSLNAAGYAGTGTTFNGANVSGSMTVNSNGVNLSLSAGAGGGGGDGGVSAGVSNLGNTLGNTGIQTAGNFVLVGSNGVTLSQSTAGGNATVTISGDQRTISGLAIQPFAGMAAGIPFAQSSISLGQNSLYLYPFQAEDNVTLDHVKLPVMVTHSSSGAASVQKGYTYQFGLFTRVNSTQISRVYSTSYTLAASHNSNASWMVSMITAIGNSTSYNTLSASSAGVNLSASLHGPRELIMPLSTLLTPGDYFVGLVASTSSVGAGGNILNLSNIAIAVQTYNRLGLSTASNNRAFFADYGMGLYSATTGAIPSTINITQINNNGTQPIMFLGTGTV